MRGYESAPRLILGAGRTWRRGLGEGEVELDGAAGGDGGGLGLG